MPTPATTFTTDRAANREYAKGMARAFAGAIIFAFPLMMTMEMWWLGFYMDRLRLLLFLVATFLLLVPLSRFVGFEKTSRLSDDVIDAVVAIGIGAAASALMLFLFGILQSGIALNDAVGKIAIQTVPASIGAVLARGQMAGGEKEGEPEKKQGGYGGELFLMTAGAVFLAFNVAPTEEMILIAYKMTPLHGLGLVALSVALLHAFVYALGFQGEERMPEGMGFMTGLIQYSVSGYGIAVLVSLYVLWTFGRTDGAAISEIVMMTAVLGFPSALGAAAARLII